MFTDDDLKKFKKGEMSYTTFEEKTGALIDRLEAAERVCKDVEPMVDHYDLKSWYKWLKVCGKQSAT